MPLLLVLLREVFRVELFRFREEVGVVVEADHVDEHLFYQIMK